MNKVVKWPHSRKIRLETYEDNTVYSVYVDDSYGTEHHLGYIHVSDINSLEVTVQNEDRSIASCAHQIWADEVEPKEDLLSNAISECIKLDEERGVEPDLD